MTVTADHVDASIPMGATVSHDGVLFRTWAPAARDVFVVTDADSTAGWTTWTPVPSARLVPLGDGTWAGFVGGLSDGAPYLFWIRGPEGGTEGFKRDPYARELASAPAFPNCPCLVCDPSTYPWRATDWHPPDFSAQVIYQLHVGAFWSVDAQGHDDRSRYGRFLDVVERLPYLRDLGVTTIQLLPIQEYDQDRGLGYAGLDYFSPEMAYQEEDPARLARHLETINAMLAGQHRPPLRVQDITSGPNQLKCLVDLCHLHGLAIVFDVVFNHAGGSFGDRSLWFYDRQPPGDPDRSLYFSDHSWAGGMVFAYWRAEVQQFLIDNATHFLTEFRIDGIRYDEVSVIHDFGGDGFCRALTETVSFVSPASLHIAEYWNWDRALPVTPVKSGGLGFDAALDDRLRIAGRKALEAAGRGAAAFVDMDALGAAYFPPPGFGSSWRTVPHLENHDVVLWDVWERRPRDLRIARLADSSDARSWYARSRARVVNALLLTAPGIPLLFMGQEILEDKPWSDDVENWPQFLVWWDGLEQDAQMRDFHRFMTDLLWIRRTRRALIAEGVRVVQVHNGDRVLVVHRWVEGAGHDLVIVASLNERTLDGYLVDLPFPGFWQEIFNSDYYDQYPNPWVTGNGGFVVADQKGAHVYANAARVTIPANGVLIFARGLPS